jgi:hypothetical protein
MQKSEYDEVMETGFVTGKSLHYLDADNRKMLTFRGLHLIHQPQVYGGHNFTSNLSEVVVSPQNGEFIHPGEHERLKQYREEQGVLEERRKQLRQYFRKPEFQRSKIGLASSPYLTGQEKSLTDQAISESVMTIDREEIKSSSYSSQQKEGVCVFCGETTTDWWYYDGKTGQCKCKACLRQGKS